MNTSCYCLLPIVTVYSQFKSQEITLNETELLKCMQIDTQSGQQWPETSEFR